MAIYFTSHLFYHIIFCFSTSLVLLSASPTLILKLIHPNQIYSLKSPHVSHVEEASFARLDYLQAKATGEIIAHLSPNIPASFMVNISIGSPPIMQLLHMDTATHLSWLQCYPCTTCYHQSLPIFDPSRSYTYSKESCITSQYSMPILRFDASTRSCTYGMRYMDGRGSRGTLAKETLTFNTIYDELSTASLPNVVFGCGHDNYGVPQAGTGVFGLGNGEFSLVNRFGSKFSYCFGSLDDPSYPYNVLTIGDSGAEISGDMTPLEIEDGLYYIKMEAISIDGTLLPIDPRVFQRNLPRSGSGGTVIDTGASLTNLLLEAYEPLKNKIEDIFDGRFKTANVAGHGNLMECYYGDFERDLVKSGFPIVTFHFSDGAELSLDVKSLFQKAVTAGAFCLTVTTRISTTLNIIGALAQQNHNIGYDLKAKTVSFERIDCGVLFDY